MNFQFSTPRPKNRIMLFLAFAIFFVSLAQTVQATALRKTPNNLNLVGYWSLNDNSGTKATDSSGKGNVGTLTNGSTWGAGRYGSGVVFDGVNDHIKIGNSLGIAGSASLTVAFWVKPTNVASGGVVAGLVNSNPNFAVFVGPFGGSGGSGSISVEYQTCGEYTVNGAVSNGVWKHVAVVKTPGTVHANTTIYVNGVAQSHTNEFSDCDPNFTGNNSFNVGAGWNSDTDFPFVGSVDDVRVYGRALTAAQVIDLYSSGATSHKQSDKLSLVGHWTFDENGGTVATDFSGRGNSGTLTNGPTFVAGKLGKALSLDGTDDYVDVGSSASLAPSTLSVSFWTKNNSNPASLDGLMCKTNGTTGSQGWGFYYNSASVIRFFVQGWNTNFAFSTILAAIFKSAC